MSWRCGRKRISSSRALPSATAGGERPFAVQKEIDYAIALLKHNGDTRRAASRKL
jgi:hypothetical protein